jgi:hypothetical protein
MFGSGVGNRKNKGYFITKKEVPQSGYANFFQQIYSLNLNSFHDQKDIEVVYDYPVEICIVEYLNNGSYSKFRFQPGLSNSNYKILEQLIKKEFPILSTSY